MTIIKWCEHKECYNKPRCFQSFLFALNETIGLKVLFSALTGFLMCLGLSFPDLAQFSLLIVSIINLIMVFI